MVGSTSAIGLLCLVLGGDTSDWNQWRGPNRDGVAPSSPALLRSFPAEGIMPLWQSETVVSGFEGGWSSPAVANGKVYVYAHYKTKKPDAKNVKRQYPWLPDDKRGHMSPEEYKEYEVKRREEDFEISKDFVFKETIYCFDALTGKTLWKNETPSVYCRFLQSGSPAVIDGKIVVLGAALNARCRDAETGAVIWDTKLPGEFSDEYYMSSFAVAEGVAVVLAGHLFGIDLATGKLLWEGDAKTTRGSHSSPVVWKTPEREWVICNVAGKQTVCLDPKTGAEAWRVDSEADQATPIVVGNKLITYGNSRKKGLRCFELSPTGAKQLWTYQGASDSGSSPVVVNGHVYVQGEKRLACVDLETGKDTWKTLLDLSNPRYTSLIAADNMIIYGMDGVLCFEANPEKYVPIIEAKIDQSGRLAAADYFRRELKLDELEKQEGGQAKAMEIFEKKITQHGPVTATTPAIANGKLYVRLKKTIACYDLSTARSPSLSSTAEPVK